MLRLLADEDFHSAITRGLLRMRSDLDLVRIQDVGLARAEDPEILAWAATEGRLVLTHDAETLIGFIYERVAAGLRMPGIVEMRQELAIGAAIEDILLLAEGSRDGEWKGQVLYLPLR